MKKLDFSLQIGCTVFDKRYTCVVPLANFYFDILVASNFAIFGYLLSNAYTLAWVVVPRLSPFYRLMQKTKKHVDRQIVREREGRAQKHFTLCLPMVVNADPFFDIYFDEGSRDLSLVL